MRRPPLNDAGAAVEHPAKKARSGSTMTGSVGHQQTGKAAASVANAANAAVSSLGMAGEVKQAGTAAAANAFRPACVQPEAGHQPSAGGVQAPSAASGPSTQTVDQRMHSQTDVAADLANQEQQTPLALPSVKADPPAGQQGPESCGSLPAGTQVVQALDTGQLPGVPRGRLQPAHSKQKSIKAFFSKPSATSAQT